MHKPARKPSRKRLFLPGLILCALAALLPALMLYLPNTAEIPFGGMLPYFGIMLLLGLLAWGCQHF